MFGFREKCTLASCILKKNKNVLLISSMSDDNEINRFSGKPEIIMAHNDTKVVVDVVDRLSANYNCARDTVVGNCRRKTRFECKICKKNHMPQPYYNDSFIIFNIRNEFSVEFSIQGVDKKN
jgi:hypothetical protein